MSDFKAFAASGGANVETQAAFVADTAVLNNGFSTGIADPLKLNKVWRQSSIMSAVLAQFIEDMSTVTSVDDGTTTALLARLKVLIGGRVSHTWLANDYIALPGGLILQWGQATTAANGKVQVTWPIAFPTACLAAYGTHRGGGGAIIIIDIATGVPTTTIGNFGSSTAFTLLNGPFAINWMAIGY